MRFSKSWIDEWVDTGLDADQLSDIITMAGLEVDTVEKVAGDFDHVVIGQVVECADFRHRRLHPGIRSPHHGVPLLLCLRKHRYAGKRKKTY